MKTHLEYYKACMKTGEVQGGNGLCHTEGIDKELLKLFTPPEEDRHELTAYWGAGMHVDQYVGPKIWEFSNSFTPLRQNIVLFMAAINNEL